MDNCLVKSFNKAVENPSLPIYGKASVNLKETEKDTYYVYIVSESGPIHVNSKIPMLPYGQQVKETSDTINSGSAKFYTIATSDIPSADYLENAIEIDNIYNCGCFIVYSDSFYIVDSIDKATTRNNIKGMWKYAPLEIAGISEEDLGVDIADSTYYLSINNASRNPLDISKYIMMPNMEVIVGGNNRNVAASALLLDINDDFSDSNVLYLGCSYKNGSLINNLPHSLKFTYASGLAGNVEDFVTAARERGRTVGALVIRGMAYVSNDLLYQDTSAKTLWNNNTIPHVTSDEKIVAVLSWDASNITWLNYMPEGYIYSPKSPSSYRNSR